MKKSDMKVKIFWTNKKIDYHRLYEILADIVIRNIDKELEEEFGQAKGR